MKMTESLQKLSQSKLKDSMMHSGKVVSFQRQYFHVEEICLEWQYTIFSLSRETSPSSIPQP